MFKFKLKKKRIKYIYEKIKKKNIYRVLKFKIFEIWFSFNLF